MAYSILVDVPYNYNELFEYLLDERLSNERPFGAHMHLFGCAGVHVVLQSLSFHVFHHQV